MSNHRAMATAAMLAVSEHSAAAGSPESESNPQVGPHSRTPSSRSRSPSPSTTTSSHSTSTGAHEGSSTSSAADQHQHHQEPPAAVAAAAMALDHSKSDPLPQQSTDNNTNTSQTPEAHQKASVELRLLVRRREAGALIGKRGMNIKRLRDTFRSSMFSIPDTGNGPERIVCLVTDERWMEPILSDITRLLVDKSLEKDDQIELKLLIHSSQAGSIIGMGGQSIKKLRNDSRAAIKIYELCCPFSNERVCAIKAKPPVVVTTIRLIHSILNENPIKGTIKPYDALHFDLMLADKYGGYLPEEPLDFVTPHYPDQALHHPYHHHHHQHQHHQHQHQHQPHLPPHHLHLQHQHQHQHQHNQSQKHYGNQVWRASDQHQHPSNCDDQTMVSAAQQSPEQQQQETNVDKQDKMSSRDEQEEERARLVNKGEIGSSCRGNPATLANGNNSRSALVSTRFHPYANCDYNRFAPGDYMNGQVSTSSLRPIYHLSLQQRQALAYRGNLHHQHMRPLPPGAQYVRMHTIPPSVFPYSQAQLADRCRHRSMGACLCLFVPPTGQYMGPAPVNGDYVAISSATTANFTAPAATTAAAVAAAAKTGFAHERPR